MLFYLHRPFNKLSIKYQSYPKSTKIDAFEQEICIPTTIFALYFFFFGVFLFKV